MASSGCGAGSQPARERGDSMVLTGEHSRRRPWSVQCREAVFGEGQAAWRSFDVRLLGSSRVGRMRLFQ